MEWAGGCLCGAIKYRSKSDPEWVGHCHCKRCQRWTGSPVFAGVCFRPDDFEWTKGEPAFYQSSGDVLRSSCPNCASPLAFHRADIRVTVTAGTLDFPERLKPSFHIYAEHEYDWAKFDDGLPRQEGFFA